ncbi:hypothetical protein ACS3SW_17485 [Roseobacteraceae bacterium S113]
MSAIPFNDARGAASLLQMAPPFAFSDVTMSVFPLRASLPTLTNFCRNYLNQAPEMVQFQPFIPYVYLVILDYGRMSIEAANMGWISQREVAFGVPLRWMSNTGKGLVFHDWAFTSPFIFVDNELSMSTGREVFGWPKLLAKLDPSVSEWVRDPHGARRVFQVSTKGTTEAYSGATSEYQPLMSVYQHRTAGLLDIPPSLDAVTKPLSQMAGITASAARLSMELSKTFLGMASDAITGTDVLPNMMDMETLKKQLEPDQIKKWLSAGAWSEGLKDSLWSMFPRAYANTINFKQFRDTSNPHSTCYQAITSAKMPVTSVKEGGFLGPQNMLLGQIDGGFHIEISDLAGLPIVDSLGLEVAETREANGTTVSRLMPVAPLWMKVDMTYGLGETVIWRGRRDRWNEGAIQTKARHAAERKRMSEAEINARRSVNRAVKDIQDFTKDLLENLPAQDPNADLEDPQSFDYLRTMNFFNTARGASEAVGGSFSLPDASVRVLPLKADPAALQTFVSDYLEIEKQLRFEAWGDLVYLVISDFKQMNSLQSGMAKRRAREMTLLVPVKSYKWYENDVEAGIPPGANASADDRAAHGRERLLTTGFVNAFTYVDDVETAITANEVFGVPCLGSSIRAAENDWLSRNHGTLNVDESILKMRAKVLPELMAGAKAVDRTLIEVCGDRDHTIHRAIETRSKSVNRWVNTLADDLQRKSEEAGEFYGASEEANSANPPKRAVETAMGFGLGLLAGEIPFNQFSLKQFRDSEKTSAACYQGLVQRRHTIRKISDVSELPGPLHVTITDFPTQPVTELLGLKPKFSYPGKDRIVRVFEPIRPFSFNGDLVRGSGMTLFERVGSKKWQAVDLPEQVFGWRQLTPELADSLWQPEEDQAQTKPPRVEVGRDPEEQFASFRNKSVSVKGADVVQKWFNGRRDQGKIKDVMVRNRSLPNAITLPDNKALDAYDPEAGTDLSAWWHHVMHSETHANHSPQDEVASLMERVSPGTILDKVLSRQWGKTEFSSFYDRRYADFCVPVSTVPINYAEALFPRAERQGKYWPQSRAFQELDTKLWRRETNAFKQELQATLRLVGLGMSGRIAQLAPDYQGDEDPLTVCQMIARELNKRLDNHLEAIDDKMVRKLAAGIDDSDDLIGASRANEELNFAFFERYLPSFVRLRASSLLGEWLSEGGTGNPVLSMKDETFQSEDWAQIVDGLEMIREKTADCFALFEDHAPDLEGLIERAKSNAARMAQQYETVSPAETLRARLKTVMSDLKD